MVQRGGSAATTSTSSASRICSGHTTMMSICTHAASEGQPTIDLALMLPSASRPGPARIELCARGSRSEFLQEVRRWRQQQSPLMVLPATGVA